MAEWEAAEALEIRRKIDALKYVKEVIDHQISALEAQFQQCTGGGKADEDTRFDFPLPPSLSHGRLELKHGERRVMMDRDSRQLMLPSFGIQGSSSSVDWVKGGNVGGSQTSAGWDNATDYTSWSQSAFLSLWGRKDDGTHNSSPSKNTPPGASERANGQNVNDGAAQSSGGWHNATDNSNHAGSFSFWGKRVISTGHDSSSNANPVDSWGKAVDKNGISRAVTQVSSPDTPNAAAGRKGEENSALPKSFEDGSSVHEWGGKDHDFSSVKEFASATAWGGKRDLNPSNNEEWENTRDHPAKSVDHASADVTFRKTRQPLDLFTSEEQEILSDVEPIMEKIRRIMNEDGYNDDDPLSAEDQEYIAANVLNYHPDKTLKIGAGINYIMVSRHGTFPESRCFYVVLKDELKQHISYNKSLKNFIRGKYPDKAEAFIAKYFRKPQPQHIWSRGSGSNPDGAVTPGDQPRRGWTRGWNMDLDTAPGEPGTPSKRPCHGLNRGWNKDPDATFDEVGNSSEQHDRNLRRGWGKGPDTDTASYGTGTPIEQTDSGWKKGWDKVVNTDRDEAKCPGTQPGSEWTRGWIKEEHDEAETIRKAHSGWTGGWGKESSNPPRKTKTWGKGSRTALDETKTASAQADTAWTRGWSNGIDGGSLNSWSTICWDKGGNVGASQTIACGGNAAYDSSWIQSASLSSWGREDNGIDGGSSYSRCNVGWDRSGNIGDSQTTKAWGNTTVKTSLGQSASLSSWGRKGSGTDDCSPSKYWSTGAWERGLNENAIDGAGESSGGWHKAIYNSNQAGSLSAWCKKVDSTCHNSPSNATPLDTLGNAVDNYGNSRVVTQVSSWGTPSGAAGRNGKEDSALPKSFQPGSPVHELDGKQHACSNVEEPACATDWGGEYDLDPSNNGERKNTRNRPAKSVDHVSADVTFTKTRQRLDLFSSEEQEILSDVEPILEKIRRIMNKDGYNDGDPLSAEDQAYIIENVLNHHPEKTLKIGAGINYVMVSKYGTFMASRCLYVVSMDGLKQDFSYRKSLENFIHGKYPDKAEAFIAKYFRKPQPRPGWSRGAGYTPDGAVTPGYQPRRGWARGWNKNPDSASDEAGIPREQPRRCWKRGWNKESDAANDEAENSGKLHCRRWNKGWGEEPLMVQRL